MLRVISMGGLVAADTLINLSKSRKGGDPIWPRIIACLAFDTPVRHNPFLSLNDL